MSDDEIYEDDFEDVLSTEQKNQINNKIIEINAKLKTNDISEEQITEYVNFLTDTVKVMNTELKFLDCGENKVGENEVVSFKYDIDGCREIFDMIDRILSTQNKIQNILKAQDKKTTIGSIPILIGVRNDTSETVTQSPHSGQHRAGIGNFNEDDKGYSENSEKIWKGLANIANNKLIQLQIKNEEASINLQKEYANILKAKNKQIEQKEKELQEIITSMRDVDQSKNEQISELHVIKQGNLQKINKLNNEVNTYMQNLNQLKNRYIASEKENKIVKNELSKNKQHLDNLQQKLQASEEEINKLQSQAVKIEKEREREDKILSSILTIKF